MDVFMAAIGLVSVFFMGWQVRIMLAQSPRSDEIPTKPRLSYWPVIGMGILVVATWVPYFLRLGEPDRVMAMQAWGQLPDSCYVVMDGNKLFSYSGKYNIAMACGIGSAMVDQFQDGLIAVSSPFSINKASVQIGAKYTPAMLENMKTLALTNPPQAASIWHSVFLLPKNADISRIKRLADVKEFGGKMVNNCEPIQ